MSTWLLLFGLAVAWVLVLAPDIIRRTSAPRHDAMSQFAQATRNLSSVQRASAHRSRRPVAVGARPQMRRQQMARPVAPVRPAGPVRRSAQAQRRQDVLLGLVAAAVLTFLGAISVGGPLVVVHFLVDLALVAFLGAMATVTRREKVRSVAPQAYLQRSYSQVAPRMVHAYDERRRIAR